jgi:hypothetical protein
MPEQVERSASTMIAPDGCAMYVDPDGNGYDAIGVLMGDTELSITWKESQEETANAGKPDPTASEFEVEGTVTIANMNMTILSELFGGLFTPVTTPASENSSIPDQYIAAGWDDHIVYDLLPETSGSDSTILKLSTQPVLTSVKIATSTTPETLTEDTDYVVSVKDSSPSGWGIEFIEAGMTEKGNGIITIDWGANTPVSRVTYHIGTSKTTIDPFALKFEHTDSASKVNGCIIHKCYPKPGSFQFGYKGASESGYETIKFTFRGITDTSQTDGRQLMNKYVDA